MLVPATGKTVFTSWKPRLRRGVPSRYRRIRVERTRHRLIEVAFRRVDLELEAMVARELPRDERLELDVHDLRRRELGLFAARRRCLG